MKELRVAIKANTFGELINGLDRAKKMLTDQSYPGGEGYANYTSYKVRFKIIEEAEIIEEEKELPSNIKKIGE